MAERILVVGAGPAGAAAAVLLARAGREVTLVEQHRFPRDKVCGECLSALAIETLTRMRLADGLQRLSAPVLSKAALHTQDGRSVLLDLPRPIWGISRRVLDEYLLNAARAAGAIVLQPARCERIDADGSEVRIRHLPTNRIEIVRPKTIVVADGKGRLTGAPPPPTGDFGIKVHFENVEGPRDTVELFGCAGLYGGLAAVEGGRWNAAFSVPAARLRLHRGNVASLFAQITKENPLLGRRLAGARPVGEWLAAPLPRFPVRSSWPPHVIPIGNAAAALEPIGGEGMGLALRSAELAVECLLGNETGELRQRYRQLWRVRRPACRIAAHTVSRAGAARLLLPLLGHSSRLAQASLRLIGK